jgi:hypothetical protein
MIFYWFTLWIQNIKCFIHRLLDHRVGGWGFPFFCWIWYLFHAETIALKTFYEKPALIDTIDDHQPPMVRTLVSGRGERPPCRQKRESTVTIKNFLAEDQACYARRGTYGCGISIEDIHRAFTDPRSVLSHQEITRVLPSMDELPCFRVARPCHHNH